jgi:hypothetical protein
MTDMVRGKVKLYGQFAKDLQSVKDSNVQKFVSYYINSHDKFGVNDDFNFIPKIMLNETSKFYSRLIQNGYKNTEVGLYRVGSPPKPIIDFKG